MDLSGIISVPGMPGLFKVLSQARNGVIVENLLDHKRTLLASTHRISSLDSISVFTTGKDLPLEEVFQAIKKASPEGVDTKSDPAQLRKDFGGIVHDFDQEKVRDSDIKRIFTWYGLLKDIESVWVEKKEEDGKINLKSDGGAEKPRPVKFKEGSARVNTHGSGTRSNIPQKKGGGG